MLLVHINMFSSFQLNGKADLEKDTSLSHTPVSQLQVKMPTVFNQQRAGESLDEFSERCVSTTESERRRSVKQNT